MCQFHTSDPDDEPYIAQEGPQIWRGDITVVYPNAEAVSAALARLRQLQADSILSSTRLSVPAAAACDDVGAARVTCPYGNRFVLRAATAAVPRRLRRRKGLGCAPRSARRRWPPSADAPLPS